MSEQPTQSAHTVTLRPITPEDEQFLFEVYASTRTEELNAVGLDKAQQEAFLDMQYKLQRYHYQTYYTASTYDLVLFDGVPVGRFIVDRTDEEIRGVDLALLPAYRSLGIGSLLLNEMKKESNESGKPFRFQVEKMNHRAHSLYLRLGFVTTGETLTHYQMEWQPVSGQSGEV